MRIVYNATILARSYTLVQLQARACHPGGQQPGVGLARVQGRHVRVVHGRAVLRQGI